MKRLALLVCISLIISCQGNKSNTAQQNQKDTIPLQEVIKSDDYQEGNLSIWNNIDRINQQLTQIKKDSSSENELEQLFKQSIQIALGTELGDEFEKMRDEAYTSNDFKTIEQQSKRCLPAINVFIMGESNNIGVNVESFIEKSTPNSKVYNFFELAKNGFYFYSERCSPGTADFPIWFERTESSFQGEINIEKAKEYLAKWKSIHQELEGFYKSVAESTINCLERYINNYQKN
jgi:hypothetical protein